MLLGRFWRAFFFLVSAHMVFVCCTNEQNEDDSAPSTPPPKAVAQISFDGGGYEIKLPGEELFQKCRGNKYLTRGTTVRCSLGAVSLNFMQCIQVQLGSTTQRSELILEGR